ncbi:acylphosphatase [Pelagovum pacificum]|uniref:Acylphosphatase n=1 Tax=Pelagovum pacificum TaxID=2588711 RepID=A0A5C5G943_9RHOB|nr:acylphosphatase [Pelagovum pacificum]QQA42159.1 acylphosphatase [Pelagovum pacificum]TNY31246.1 acylphosphatase [Pelagovum pacificum]
MPITRRESFRIVGDVQHETFPPWILRYGTKLGLEDIEIAPGDGTLSVSATGQPDLLDAMELGCSLGPIDVSVDEIDRTILNSADS